MRLEEDETRFLRQLRARMVQFCERVSAGKLPAAYASFELLSALYSAKEIEQKKLSETFPSQNWRDDTVEVPRALLAPLAQGWLRHREGEVDLSAAFELAASSKGKKPSVKAELTRERDIRLSNMVVIELIEAELSGSTISVDAACATVQEKLEAAVGYRVIERAYRTYGYEAKKAVHKAISE